jgi:hypothetical protein
MRKATGVLLGTAVIWAAAAVMLSAYARARADEPTAGPGAPEPARGFADWDNQDESHARVRQATDWDELGDRPALSPRDDAESRGGPAGFGDDSAPRRRADVAQRPDFGRGRGFDGPQGFGGSRGFDGQRGFAGPGFDGPRRDGSGFGPRPRFAGFQGSPGFGDGPGRGDGRRGPPGGFGRDGGSPGPDGPRGFGGRGPDGPPGPPGGMGRGPSRDDGRGPGREFPGRRDFGYDGDDDGRSADVDADRGPEVARFDDPAWDRD